MLGTIDHGNCRALRAKMTAMHATRYDPPPQAARLAPKLRALADRGVYFGTSSWKYEGWLGSIYSRDRYITRAEKKGWQEPNWSF